MSEAAGTDRTRFQCFATDSYGAGRHLPSLGLFLGWLMVEVTLSNLQHYGEYACHPGFLGEQHGIIRSLFKCKFSGHPCILQIY